MNVLQNGRYGNKLKRLRTGKWFSCNNENPKKEGKYFLIIDNYIDGQGYFDGMDWYINCFNINRIPKKWFKVDENNQRFSTI